jgi:hypothetical protein
MKLCAYALVDCDGGFFAGNDRQRRRSHPSGLPARAPFIEPSPIATVDATGALTALAPGSATITARYDWTLPLGGGNTRVDHVIANLAVTVAG